MFCSCPTHTDNAAMQILTTKQFSTWTDLQCPPVRIKCQFQRKKMLSNTCLFGEAVSMHSLSELYLVMKIWVHNLIFYANSISRLTFEGQK